MIFKRTGWQVIVYESFVDVTPQDDEREHAIGDECWCEPQICVGELYKNGMTRVVHNSADGREKNEYESRTVSN